MENKGHLLRQFEDSAQLLLKVSDILQNIKASDMPNFNILPKDERFSQCFREYKIRVLKDQLSIKE